MNQAALRSAVDALQKPGTLFRLERVVSAGSALPDRIHLTVEAPLLRGSGVLVLDNAQGRYGGSLALQLPAVSVSANVLLAPLNSTTGTGWTLLIILTGQWVPPIPLLYGFTLSGVGGLVGLHRGFDEARIVADLQTSSTAVLCPDAPGAGLDPLIQRLEVLFPVRQGSLTLGPMLILGWGIPNLLQARLAVLAQIDDVLNGNPPALKSLLLLGQLEVRLPAGLSADKSLMRLLVDVTGSLDCVERTFGFKASLRDSRIGHVGLQGMFVMRAGWGAHPSFVLAAGGFHPRFRDIPEGLPKPIERIGAAWSIGGASLTLTGYFAVTPATVQAGGRISARASACDASVEGEFSFDTLFEFEPDFHFEIDANCSVSARWHGHDLCGVRLSGRLTGPGRWTFRGHAKFDVWLTTVSVSINEAWGSAPALPAPAAVSLSQLLEADVVDRNRWRAQCRLGTPAWIIFSGDPEPSSVLAHPSGDLVFSQNRFPLDLELAHVGRAPISGGRRAAIEAVTLDGKSILHQPELESFARSAFVDLDSEQRLAGASFELLPAGVHLNTADSFVCGTEQSVALTYEVGYACLNGSEPPQDGQLLQAVSVLQATALWDQSLLARARWRLKERASSETALQLQVTDVPLVVVDARTLAPTETLTGAARFAWTLARQADPHNLVLEDYEVARVKQ